MIENRTQRNRPYKGPTRQNRGQCAFRLREEFLVSSSSTAVVNFHHAIPEEVACQQPLRRASTSTSVIFPQQWVVLRSQPYTQRIRIGSSHTDLNIWSFEPDQRTRQSEQHALIPVIGAFITENSSGFSASTSRQIIIQGVNIPTFLINGSSKEDPVASSQHAIDNSHPWRHHCSTQVGVNSDT